MKIPIGKFTPSGLEYRIVLQYKARNSKSWSNSVPLTYYNSRYWANAIIVLIRKQLTKISRQVNKNAN